MNNKKTMMELEKAMFLPMFEANKQLVNLVTTRTMLNKMRSQIHKDIYNNTTKITKIEESLKNIVLDLDKKIPE